MGYLTLLLCILLSSAIILRLFPSKQKLQNLPPGPKPLPIFGNLFNLGNKPHKSLADLAKIHGPIMSLHLGQLKTIVISSSSLSKQVLQKNDAVFSNRTVPDSLTALQHHDFSIVFSPVGGHWRTLRKICNSHVFSNARLDASQDLRHKKLDELLSYVESCRKSGVAVDVGEAAFSTTMNFLSNTFFSVDLVDQSSGSSREWKEVVWRIMVEAGTPNVSDYFPGLRRLDPQGIRRRMGVQFGKMIDLFEGMIRRRGGEDEGGMEERNDTLDALLKISREKSEELELYHIPHMLLDLFAAGTETTSSTVEWAMAELLSNPDKMKKAREELEHAVGKGNPIKEEDVNNLPYLQSVIKETFRIHPPVPFLIPRKTDTDVQLCGFTVPKNSQVLINVWAMGQDSSLWENPGSFEPERFLGSEIDVKGRDFELIPFGAGRRICPGLPLAVRMLPLMLGSLINCYGWKVEDGSEAGGINMEDKFGITLQKAESLRVIPVKA